MKNNIFARFARAVFIFWHFVDVLVLSTTWNDLFCRCVDDVSTWWQMFNVVFLCPRRWFQFNSRLVRTHFSRMMILNNWKMIAETRSYIFIWRSRFRRRCVCLSSLSIYSTQWLNMIALEEWHVRDFSPYINYGPFTHDLSEPSPPSQGQFLHVRLCVLVDIYHTFKVDWFQLKLFNVWMCAKLLDYQFPVKIRSDILKYGIGSIRETKEDWKLFPYCSAQRLWVILPRIRLLFSV